MFRIIFTIVLFFFSQTLFCQPSQYTVANAHSHNDYEQVNPFYAAFSAGFGSIEADIFLVGDELIVAHDKREVLLHRTLDSMYLLPLQNALQANNNLHYNQTHPLQLLIDIKTDSIETVKKLTTVLNKFPALIHSGKVQFVLTGNLPDQSLFTQFPNYILFDGVLHKNYGKDALQRIVMLSDDFENYTHWNGVGVMPAKDKTALQDVISKAHTLGKKVRFWDAPDNGNA